MMDEFEKEHEDEGKNFVIFFHQQVSTQLVNAENS